MYEVPITLILELLPSLDNLPHSTTIYTLQPTVLNTANDLFLTLVSLGVKGRANQLIEQFTDSLGACSFRSQRFTGRAWNAIMRPPAPPTHSTNTQKRKRDGENLMELPTEEDEVGVVNFLYVLYNETGMGYDLLASSKPVDPIRAYPNLFKELQQREIRQQEAAATATEARRRKSEFPLVEVRLTKREIKSTRVSRTVTTEDKGKLKVQFAEGSMMPPAEKPKAPVIEEPVFGAVRFPNVTPKKRKEALQMPEPQKTLEPVEEKRSERRSTRIQKLAKDKENSKGKEKENIDHENESSRSLKRQKTEKETVAVPRRIAKSRKGKEPVRP